VDRSRTSEKLDDTGLALRSALCATDETRS
jgi:hypothetical protein